jgi:triacylglycerol lipase
MTGMRSLIFCIFSTLGVQLFAQMQNGFLKGEAREMIALCNSFSFVELYNSDASILPGGYKKIYTSGVFGMDNKYQIYKKGDTAVICLRGSTSKKLSWMENINSAMVPAIGVIRISGEDFTYCFAKDTAASVHSGYALGITCLSKDLLYHINILNNQGIYDIIVTGHSQGGALANLLRAYLENLSHYEISSRNKFKTYAFAAPMIGNKNLVAEYNSRYCSNNSSFNIVIPSDPVPDMPFSYNDGNYIRDNLNNFLFQKDSFSTRKLMTDILFNAFSNRLNNGVKKMSNTLSRQISKDLGTVEMPPYKNGLNYCKIGNRITISNVEYPKILKDSAILRNDSLMAVYKVGPDGLFENKDLYRKEPYAYQHQPYNYYVSILKTFFKEQYAILRRKYLPENLE